MTRSYQFWLVVLFVLLMSGCRMAGDQDEQPQVSVSIVPLAYFTDQLTDEGVSVNVMVPPGASHATYSPSTSQLQALSDADIYFRIGHLGYEQVWMDRLAELGQDMEITDLSANVDLIRGEPVDHGDHVHEGGVDPHIWMSPATMLELLPVFKQTLSETYPAMADQISANHDSLYERVQDLHTGMLQLSEELEQKSFMIFHPALTYLARDYGLEQIPIEYEGKEPTPGRLRRIIDQARATEIPVIFIQEEFDERSAELVSRESGASLIQINPMAYNWFEGMEEIMDAFKDNLR